MVKKEFPLRPSPIILFLGTLSLIVLLTLSTGNANISGNSILSDYRNIQENQGFLNSLSFSIRIVLIILVIVGISIIIFYIWDALKCYLNSKNPGLKKRKRS